PSVITSLSGPLKLLALGPVADDIRARYLPHERRVFGKTGEAGREGHSLAPLRRGHFLFEPVKEALPLVGVNLQLPFKAAWKDAVWWLRVQDPVNPRRDLMNLPVRVVNATPNRETHLSVILDFWDVMLDPGTRLWLELMPMAPLDLILGGKQPAQL